MIIVSLFRRLGSLPRGRKALLFLVLIFFVLAAITEPIIAVILLIVFAIYFVFSASIYFLISKLDKIFHLQMTKKLKAYIVLLIATPAVGYLAFLAFFSGNAQHISPSQSTASIFGEPGEYDYDVAQFYWGVCRQNLSKTNVAENVYNASRINNIGATPNLFCVCVMTEAYNDALQKYPKDTRSTEAPSITYDAFEPLYEGYLDNCTHNWLSTKPNQ